MNATQNQIDCLSALSENEFMQPYLYRGTVYAVTDEWGEIHYGSEISADIEAVDIEVLEGFLPYVAANGYLDRVDLGFYESEWDAVEALIDYYRN